MNEILLLIKTIMVFTMIIIINKKYNKEGLMCWICISSILANIIVAKNISVFGINATLGNVLFASNFIASNMLNEYYGEQYATKAIKMSLYCIICYLVISQLTILFRPNEIDIISDNINNIFALSPRICISSILMYYLSNILNVKLYSKIKNNITVIICNCLENFGFVFLAFIGTFSFKDIILIAVSTSIIEMLISLCSIPFIKFNKKINKF